MDCISGVKASSTSMSLDAILDLLVKGMSRVTTYMVGGQMKLGLLRKVLSTMAEGHSSSRTTSITVLSQIFLSKAGMTARCIS